MSSVIVHGYAEGIIVPLGILPLDEDQSKKVVEAQEAGEPKIPDWLWRMIKWAWPQEVTRIDITPTDEQLGDLNEYDEYGGKRDPWSEEVNESWKS